MSELPDKQLKENFLTPRKDTFVFIFILLVLMLLLYPFLSTFSDLLTRFVVAIDVYKVIQNHIVPWEIRMVGTMLIPFGVSPRVIGGYLAIGSDEPFLIEIAWNCVGWQSVLFFLLTGWVGFQGDKYTNVSKIKAWCIGFLGTILMNLVRITIVCLSAYFFGQFWATVIHDYGSTLFTIAWLFLFWWFSYTFVLEEKSV